MPTRLPIVAVTRPSVLVGQKNGMLPATLLWPTSVHGLTMVPPAARAARAMADALRAAGFEPGTVGPYRSFDGQLAMWNSRMVPVNIATYLLTAPPRRRKWPDVMPLDSPPKPAAYIGKVYWRRDSGAGCAVPGTSNHGWGLANDWAEWRGPVLGGMTPAMISWLLANAAKYGFSWEDQSENWHLRYVTGDIIPPDVRDYEAGTPRLFLGDQFDAVKRMQSIVGAKMDGGYGPKTAAAIGAWRTAHGLTGSNAAWGPDDWKAAA